MKKTTILLLSFMMLYLASCAQNNNNDFLSIAGTQLKIRKSNQLIKSTDFPGYVDTLNNISIIAYQSYLTMTFDEALNKQLNSVEKVGIKLIDKTTLTHEGFEAILLELPPNQNGEITLLLLFGKENLQCFISANCNKEKKYIAKEILLTSIYDDQTDVKINNQLGFEALESSGNLKRVNNSSMVLNYESTNSASIQKSYLKLFKPLGGQLNVQTAKEGANNIYQYYAKESEIIKSEEFITEAGLVGYKIISRKNSLDNLKQLYYVIFFNSKKFQIIGIGASFNNDYLQNMDKIVKSIRITE